MNQDHAPAHGIPRPTPIDAIAYLRHHIIGMVGNDAVALMLDTLETALHDLHARGRGPLLPSEARPSAQVARITVNGETVVSCYDCDDLFTTSNADLDDADYLWRCYGCLSLDTGDGWGITPN